MLTKDLEKYLNNLLSIEDFKDYCPNGLQVEGGDSIQKVITGVTASQALIDEAVSRNAQAILVHHGYFWRGEGQGITGIKKNRIKTLLEHDISLFAYHLPLDAHPQFGNNIQLSQLIGLEPLGALQKMGKHDMGLVCQADKPLSLASLKARISQALNHDVLVLGPESHDREVRSIALCTGGAQSMFEAAIEEHGIDVYITGEVSEQNFHLANEYGCNFFAVGHHASERYGVKALGEHLQAEKGLAVEFIDIPNPV